MSVEINILDISYNGRERIAMKLLKLIPLLLFCGVILVVPSHFVYAASPTIVNVYPTYLLKRNDYEIFSITYSDTDGWTNINYVDLKIDTWGTAQTFTLRWTQSTDIFSEEIDASGICSIYLPGCSVQVISGTVARVNYEFQVTGGTYGPATYTFTVVDDEAHSVAQGVTDGLFYWDEDASDMFIFWDSTFGAGTKMVAYGWGVYGQINDYNYAVNYQLLNKFVDGGSLTAPSGPIVSNQNAIYVWGELTNRFAHLVFYMWNPTTIYHSFSATNAIYNSTTVNLSNLGLIEPGMVNVPATSITNMEGCGNWIFANEKYYNFVGTFNYTLGYTHLINMSMRFTDGVNWIIMSYNQTSGVYSASSTPADVVSLGASSHTYFGNNTIAVTFPIFLKSGILDAYNIDIWTRSEDDLGVVTAWTIAASDYFSIYNLGGKAEYSFNGNGAQTPAGDVFYLQVTNAEDYARANVTFRKMQHAHILFGINVNETLQGDELKEVKDYNAGFQVETALWYCDPSHVWVKGLSAVIDIMGNDVSEVSSNWCDIHWRVRWYNAQGVLLRTDDVSSYNHAFTNAGENPTGNPISWMWIDMWYNNINGSRVIGGRITSYEIGIWEHAWWAGGTYSYGWGNVTQSMCFTDLKAHDGDIISSAQLDLMKLSFNLTKPAVGASSYTIKLSDFDIFTVKRIVPAQGHMLGIDTPSSEFEPTKKPDLPAGGFLGGISAMLSGIGGFFVAALAGAAGIFISAVDGILSTFGFGTHTFSDLMSVISALVTNLGIWTGYVATQISNMISFIGYVIIWVVTFVQYVMSTIIWFGTNALYLFVFPLQMLAAFFTGGKFTLPFSSIEADFAGSFPVVSAFLAITPIFTLIFFMQWFIQDGIFAIPGKVISIFNTTRLLFDAMFWIFRFVWNLIVSLINFIKGFIPTMGGGGGQLPEA